MTKEERYQATAEQLLQLVGGPENIISAAHCATRLRLVLKDESKADVDGILKVDLVKGQFANAGQFQIIIGSGTVDEVYKRFIQLGGIAESTKSEVKKAADKKMNPVQQLVKMLSDVFVPLIPALVASGLMMGLNNVLTASGLFFPGQSLVEAYPGLADLASMINTCASAAYSFLPILIGFSAAKMFGGNPYLGAVIGMIMVSGDLLNAYSYGDAVNAGVEHLRPDHRQGGLPGHGAAGAGFRLPAGPDRKMAAQARARSAGQPGDAALLGADHRFPHLYGGGRRDAHRRRLDHQRSAVVA